MEHVPLGPGIGLAQILGNNSEETPLHCGSYRMEAGSETVTDYPCTIFCLVLEGKSDSLMMLLILGLLNHEIGEFTAEDTSKPGEVLHLKKHDIFRADKGISVKWASPTGGHCTSDPVHYTSSSCTQRPFFSLLCHSIARRR